MSSTFFFLIAILILIEALSILALRSLSKGGSQSILAWLAYWVWTALINTSVIYAILYRDQFSDPKMMNVAFIIIGFWLMNFFSKLILAFFYLLNQFTGLFIKKSAEEVSQNSRRQFLTKAGLALASVPFLGFFYGMVRGRYKFKVWKQDLLIQNLPESFIGKTIVQLSDMHLGSFPQGEEAVAKAIEQVNALEPDYIFFTGDMINERAIEAEPWVDTIKKLHSKFGKFSILGNHDYGDYYGPWAGKPDKIEANVQHLQALQEKMGFQLLRNENVLLKQGEATVRLIGLENWGVGFKQKGDLKKAMEGVDDTEVQILLSHDPTHWEKQVLGKTSIDVSLAGHTHGAQLGVETPAFRWSPAKYRYPRWAGLYREQQQQLYVNRGFGYIGYAGRVGIWPEITLFTLQKA